MVAGRRCVTCTAITWQRIWIRAGNRPLSPTTCRIRNFPTTPSSNVVDKVLVTCVPGLEDILSTELRALRLEVESCEQKSRRRGQVAVRNLKHDDLFRCCLYVGSASTVRWHCASFTARGMAELRRKTAKIDWSLYLKDPLDGGEDIKSNPYYVDVRVKASKSKLYHTAAIRERVLMGIYESFGHNDIDKADIEKTANDLTQSDDDPQSKADNLLLDVQIEKDQVDIYVNASPIPLHQRGYRYQVAKAPLREDIAYSMLVSAGWTPSWMSSVDCGDQTSERDWEGLVDPFCGSGTIAIEGVAMAVGLPPGRLKPTPFQGTVLEDPSKWKTLVRDACIASIKNNTAVHVSASDRDAGAIQATTDNAKRAGVWKYLEGNVHQASLSGQSWFEQPSCSPSSFLVVTNPPFGKRVSNKDKLLPLYQTLGHLIRRTTEQHARKIKGVLLTDDTRFVKTIGPEFQFKKLLRTSHGGVKVSAVELEMKHPSNGRK